MKQSITYPAILPILGKTNVSLFPCPIEWLAIDNGRNKCLRCHDCSRCWWWHDKISISWHGYETVGWHLLLLGWLAQCSGWYRIEILVLQNIQRKFVGLLVLKAHYFVRIVLESVGHRRRIFPSMVLRLLPRWWLRLRLLMFAGVVGLIIVRLTLIVRQFHGRCGFS